MYLIFISRNKPDSDYFTYSKSIFNIQLTKILLVRLKSSIGFNATKNHIFCNIIIDLSVIFPRIGVSLPTLR